MSARMCTIFGDNKWRSRYREWVPKMVLALDGISSQKKVLKDKYSVSTWADIHNSGKTRQADNFLVFREEQAMKFCEYDPTHPKKIQTKRELFDTDYYANKEIINDQNVILNDLITQLVIDQQSSNADRQDTNIVIIVIILFVVFVLLASIGRFQIKLSLLEAEVNHDHNQVLQYEQRDWLSTDALQHLRSSIIQDIRRATQRRWDEASESQREHLEVLKAPTDLDCQDLPVTYSTMLYMENKQ